MGVLCGHKDLGSLSIPHLTGGLGVSRAQRPFCVELILCVEVQTAGELSRCESSPAGGCFREEQDRYSPRAGALRWVFLSSSTSVLGEEKSLFGCQKPQNAPVCGELSLQLCSPQDAADPGCRPLPHGSVSREAWMSRGHFLFLLEAGAIAGREELWSSWEWNHRPRCSGALLNHCFCYNTDIESFRMEKSFRIIECNH